MILQRSIGCMEQRILRLLKASWGVAEFSMKEGTCVFYLGSRWP